MNRRTPLAEASLRARATIALGCLAVSSLLAAPSHAARLVAVVSERSAPQLLAAVSGWGPEAERHEILLRTPEQLASLSDAEVAALWHRADCVLLLAVFGPEVDRLARLLDTSPPPAAASVLSLHGDLRLTRRTRLDGVRIFANADPEMLTRWTTALGVAEDVAARAAELAREYPPAAPWLTARTYWLARGTRNVAGLLAWSLARHDPQVVAPPVRPRPALRFWQGGRVRERSELSLTAPRGLVAVLDYDAGDGAGDAAVLTELCGALEQRQLGCLGLLARWGEPSVAALQALPQLGAKWQALVVMQDFVVGGGSGRDEATRALRALDVPVFKALRLRDQSRTQWRLSGSGLNPDSVHYRVAMPEIQGVGQPHVLATAGEVRDDPRTGLRMRPLQSEASEIGALAQRIARFVALREKPPAQKRVALVYYNHPPGRHNIGADNLDVPESLLELLRTLRDAGYDTGELPPDSTSLLRRLQLHGVNVPEDRTALARMAESGIRVSGADYRAWLARQPARIQRRLSRGPLADLEHQVRQGLAEAESSRARGLVQRTLGDVRHLIEGSDHAARAR
ncbi:MAG: cobaltochelatase subunit CobN, partial [Proteobacteria bacterium]|nr:cobaltochelatase subunit CobN [Pseudomonadota bacterium]